MKTPDQLDQLLEDVLAFGTEDEWRSTSLRAGLHALQRRRRRLAFQRTSALVVLPLFFAGALLFFRFNGITTSQPDRIAGQTDLLPPAERFFPGTSIRLISDEELFALFPGRPLALVGPKGNQELVFLDEMRTTSRHVPN